MTSISRDRFPGELAGADGFLNVNDLRPGTEEALEEAGVDAAELARIAGADGQISTESEFERLFDRLDRKDRDGSRATIELGEKGQRTNAGEAFDQMKAEIERNRAQAHQRGIIHLGMRGASSAEVDALRRVTPDGVGGVHAIRASASTDSVELDGKTYNLAKDDDLGRYKTALQTGSLHMPADKAEQLATILGNAKDGTRDELAQLGVALFQVGNGQLPANRLVLSGHGNGTELVDDLGTKLSHRDVREVAKAFPEGAGKIEHLAFSSCFSATNAGDLAQTRQAFPNLKGLWAYAEFSPSAEKGAPRDLVNWAGKTDGDDPSRLDPTGRNVATWNKAEGEQNMVRVTPRQAEAIADRADEIVDAYASGKKNPAGGAHDGELAAAYVRVTQAWNAEGISDELRTRLEQLKSTMYVLRHPD
jgi:hypothetical protein